MELLRPGFAGKNQAGSGDWRKGSAEMRVEMNFEVCGYELKKKEELSELKSTGLVYRHKKTGARVAVLSNEDDNKVFSIGFRTPPKDSTGVAHIIEHTVLCGSEKFPAKDPFIELAKGSLNTFLNAMTYPDKTLYPIASCNDKDFANLMHVYLDAVFYPMIQKKEEIFKQEGWHYELEDPEGEITYNGVVYNEMKGAFSSPEQTLYRLIQQSVLPDTCYGVESGGDPDFIPDLAYEDYLGFYKKYYHPSNSYIYLYGDMDVEERLTWIDENYLGHFEGQPADSEIKEQEPFKEMRIVEEEYPVGEEESLDEKTYLSYNVVIENSLDEKLYLAFQIIEYALLSAPGAPLKQAILDAGIGKDVLSSYDNGLKQPVFSIIAKNGEASQKEKFVEVIKESLRKITEAGIDQRALEGAINYFEFKYREADFGQYPKGLMYGLQIMDSWLYDEEKPFIHICADKTFEFLKQSIGSGYYEKLISKYLLNNTHCALVVVKPRQGLTAEKENKVKEKLRAYKESLTEEEIQKLIQDTKKLHEYEMMEPDKEDNEKIPMLSREDIGKKTRKLINQVKDINGVKVLHHSTHTNEIGYLRFCFDITSYGHAAAYLGLLLTVLGYVDTKNYSYLELSNEINIHTGGMISDVNVYNKKDGAYQAFFEIKTKMIYKKLPKALELVKEILKNTLLEDEKRLKEILSEIRSRMEMRLMSKGHVTAVDRAMSYFSEAALFEELSGGISYYDFIVDMDTHFDEKKTQLIEGLKKWLGIIFSRDKLIISFTADDKGYGLLEGQLKDWLEILPKKAEAPDLPLPKPEKKNEGFKTPGQVQYVARCGSFIGSGLAYTGALRVLKIILSYDYLWNHIRVKGGAYGCMCGFSMDGKGYFTSYRDPNLRETDEVYQGIYDYIHGFDVDERDMTRYVIGAISAMDTPLNPSAKGSRSFAAYICNVSYEDLQKEREQVLSCTAKDIRSTAKIARAIVESGNLCVVGNETKIEENKDMFFTIKGLLE